LDPIFGGSFGCHLLEDVRHDVHFHVRERAEAVQILFADDAGANDTDADWPGSGVGL
jgi:hypothetical protein